MLLEDFKKDVDARLSALEKKHYDETISLDDPMAKIFAVAKKELGVHEIPGPQNEQRIADYGKSTGVYEGDQTPWCANFVCWCIEQAGFKSTDRASAKSFMSWGEKSPGKVHDVVVLWRGSPTAPTGHVGFVHSFEPDGSIWILGGNQSDRVSIVKYPKDRLLGFRRIANKDD